MKNIKCRYGDFFIVENENDLIYKSLRIYGEWAQNEIDLISHFIKPGSRIIDVGAYIGTHTRAFSNIVGELGAVYSFEPNPISYNILEENKKCSMYNNISLFQIGLGDTSKYLYYKTQNFGSSFLVNLDLTQDVDSVQVKPLDYFNLNKIDFIKVDIEGMEAEFLVGGAETIRECKPVMLLEINSVNSAVRILEWAVSTQYIVVGAVFSAYNLYNFNNSLVNIFGDAKECGLLLIHKENFERWSSELRLIDIPVINSIDDMVLLLLQKPQYFFEILKQTSVAKKYGIDIKLSEMYILEEELANTRSELANTRSELQNIQKDFYYRFKKLLMKFVKSLK